MTATLPYGYTLRHPNRDDLQAIADLIIACDMAESGTSDFSSSELQNYWNAPGFDLASDAWVAIAPDEQIAGYEEVHSGGEDKPYNLDGYVHPDHSGLGIGTYLLHIIEARVCEKATAIESLPERKTLIRAHINTNSATASQLFEAEGYSVERHFWRMELPLAEPPPAPEWPTGFAVRTFVLGQDERATHAANEEAFKDHWGHTYAPFEEWKQSRLQRDNFDPTLWFLALDGDEIAGMALCFPRGDAGGWVQNLGVRRPWRRSGLGLALLCHAFGVFHKRGKAWVGLGVDAASPTGATRLYERAGMQVTERYTTYEKAL